MRSLKLFSRFQFGPNERLIGVAFNSGKSEDSISDGRGQNLLHVRYKNGVLPVEWSSNPQHNCSQAFDRWNNIFFCSRATNNDPLSLSRQHTHSQSLPIALTLSLSISPSLTYTVSQYLPLILTLYLNISLSHSHCLSTAPSLTHTLSQSLPLVLTLSLNSSLSHSHTLSLLLTLPLLLTLSNSLIHYLYLLTLTHLRCCWS